MTASSHEFICICCPMGCMLHVDQSSGSLQVSGNKCPRGKEYALEEMQSPKRFVTSTVRIDGWIYPVIPVKTEKKIPKDKIFDVMQVLSDVILTSPKTVGDVVVKNILNLGIDIIVTKNTAN